MIFTPISALSSSLSLPKKGTPCVYVLKDANDVIFYVGQTTMIKSRLNTHSKSKADFCSFFVKEVSEGALNNEEARLIIKYKPRENKRLPTNDFYVTKGLLKRQLEGKISEFINNLDSDFHIQTNEKHQVFSVQAYKALLCHSSLDDFLLELNSIIEIK